MQGRLGFRLARMGVAVGRLAVQAQRAVVVLAAVGMVLQWSVPAFAAGPVAQDAGWLAGLVKKAVHGIIILTGLIMVFAIAFAGFKGVLGKLAGAPYAEANAIMTVIGVVLMFLLTIGAIPLSNAIINSVMEGGPKGEDIVVPEF